MAWDLLPVDYTDAAWVGLKRYNQIDNEDGTISLQDVTVYSSKEKSFFGAKDANRMNEALNTLMSMVENGTDLYTEFQNYFADQKNLFEAAANVSQEDFNAYIESLKADADTTVEGIKTDYAEDMQDFQNQQEELFQLWFDYVKGQLGQDVAGNLLNEIIAVKETSDAAKAITDTKGQANGLATLDDTGKLVQMPTLADIGAKSNENLLDNWYFADPINQRGIALNTAFADIGQYFIDRWILIDGTVILTANGLVLDGTIRQKRETALNTNFTASVFASSGTATAVYNDTTKYFDITCNGGTIVAAKLEIGDVSTIKRKDANGNWILNDPPPNKALELAKCQRYYWNTKSIISNYSNLPHIFTARTTSRIYGVISVPVPMRTTPIVRLIKGVAVRTSDARAIKIITPDICSFLNQGIANNQVTVDINLTDGTTPFTIGTMYNLIFNNKVSNDTGIPVGGYMEFDANL